MTRGECKGQGIIQGDIMFPGDASAAPGNVYNCRCTLGYVYPDYPAENEQRRDNETGEIIENMTYREWEAMKQIEQNDIYSFKNYNSESDFDRIIDALRSKRQSLFDLDEYDKAETDALLNKILRIQDMKKVRHDANALSDGDKAIRKQLLSSKPEKVMQGIESVIDGNRYGLPDSKWSGVAKIRPDDEMKEAAAWVVDSTKEIHFRKKYLHEYTTGIHEDLHCRSIHRYTTASDRQWVPDNIRGYEEGIVQLMAESICEQAGIEPYKTYTAYTDAWRVLHQTIDQGLNKHQFAKKMFDLTPMERYNYITDAVYELKNNHPRKWKRIGASVNNALSVLKEKKP